MYQCFAKRLLIVSIIFSVHDGLVGVIIEATTEARHKSLGLRGRTFQKMPPFRDPLALCGA